MAGSLEAAPVLSTPDTRLLESTEPTISVEQVASSDEQIYIIYDIERTIREIKEGKWRRIALQFPDAMLPDAPRVFQLLSRGLNSHIGTDKKPDNDRPQEDLDKDGVNSVAASMANDLTLNEPVKYQVSELYILADTSYGTCCVDEVAAEHVNADVVVHYGKACLSPTARLPVIYIFTHRPLDHEAVIQAFEESYPNKEERVVLVTDVIYADHIEAIRSALEHQKGYTNTFATEVVHDPSSPIPNRTIPLSVREVPESLKEWQLFHLAEPPAALLLTLSSRVAAVRIYPVDFTDNATNSKKKSTLLASTTISLRRRYAILTSLSTAPVFGILVNTLSVKNYLHMVQHVQKRIAEAGKKSYLFVVGKLNMAKVANFSEIEGWVVIGCWESSLVESKDFWRPVITPYELEITLQADSDRVWTGEWRSDYQSVLDSSESGHAVAQINGDDTSPSQAKDIAADIEQSGDDDFSEPESAPPDFDLRTGRYVSTINTRPMQESPQPSMPSNSVRNNQETPGSTSVAKRTGRDVATIGGVISPGAEFLRSKRTWAGLGSDFVIEYEDDAQGSAVVEGRSGIARGYTHGGDSDRR
ncbi:Diphthamide biosynthesis protein 2 [Myotisia sp. PD_48]|nr:Diphthamide biosynthesis protein 2 [Myotisia sp. PD_48]